MMSPARASTNLPHQGLAVQFTGRVTHHPGLLCYLSTRFVPVHGLTPKNNLDLILHLPGGSAEVREAIVQYLRSRFTDIRVFIPQAAMSAASMLSCAANRIVMGSHSFMGPIDPQFVLRSEERRVGKECRYR